MNGAQHYAEAERILAVVRSNVIAAAGKQDSFEQSHINAISQMREISSALVHATLADTAATLAANGLDDWAGP